MTEVTVGNSFGLVFGPEDITLDPPTDIADDVEQVLVSATQISILPSSGAQLDLFGLFTGIDPTTGLPVGTVTGITASMQGELVLSLSDINMSVTEAVALMSGQGAVGIAQALLGGNDAFQGGDLGDVFPGFMGDDILSGGSGFDELRGGAGNDLVSGNMNGDRLFGGGGNDTVRGGSGRDTVRGGKDADMLFGGGGKDEVRGGQGDDTLNGGLQDDTLIGALGNDVFVFDQPGGGDNVTGRDTILDFTVGEDVMAIAAGVNGTDIDGVDDLLGRVISNGAGGAFIDLGDDNGIDLQGVEPDTLSESDFMII